MSAPVGHCVHCNEPVFGDHAETDPASHPCCAWWIGELGCDRCWACIEARRLRREHHRRFHTRPPRPDPRCELCVAPPGRQRSAIGASVRPSAPRSPSDDAVAANGDPGALRAVQRPIPSVTAGGAA